MTRDYEQFPDDDNGNVLWQMAEDGDDLTELHEIEFQLHFKIKKMQSNVHSIYFTKNKKFHFSKMTLLSQTNG